MRTCKSASTLYLRAVTNKARLVCEQSIRVESQGCQCHDDGSPLTWLDHHGNVCCEHGQDQNPWLVPHLDDNGPKKGKAFATGNTHTHTHTCEWGLLRHRLHRICLMSSYTLILGVTVSNTLEPGFKSMPFQAPKMPSLRNCRSKAIV